MKFDNALKGKCIILTGGLGLLGRAFTEHLSEAGAAVHVIDVTKPAQRHSHGRVIYHTADITKEDELERVRRDILRKSKRIDALICNAALNPKVESGQKPLPFEKTDIAQWEHEMQVNVTGTMLCCKVFGGAMKRGSSIVIVSSVYGITGPDQRLYDKGFIKPASYSTSKAALIGLTKYLAAYWGAKGVRTNCIVLGGVQAGQDQAFIKRYAEKTPLRRMARPADYTGIVEYLVSDASRYASGAVFTVDGGFTAW